MNNKFFKAILCVTFFSVLTRALGFLLKIYLSRSLGSVLLGSYQVAMSIFGVLMTLVSSGIPVVLSRNVSYYSGKKNKKAIGSIVSSGLILTGMICLIVSLIVLLFPNLMSKMFTSTASSEMILILLPALISSSIYEVLRGALWGTQNFFTISFTEFIEQVIRIVILMILFNTTFLKMSLTNKTALSLSLACIISSIIVCIIYFKKGGTLANPKHEFKNLLKTSSPITAVRTVSSVVSSIISIIIPIRLMTYGYSSTEALSEFGIIMGMTFPLIMIPSTLIGSLAVTIIPSISEQSNDIDNNELKDKSILKSKINFALRTTVVFSSILISTFAALGIPICNFLYKNQKAGIYLCFATITMIPMGISQITSSILNAIGLEMKSLKNYVFSSSLLILSILFLPKYIGTYSLIAGYLLMSLTSSILNLKMLSKRSLVNFDFLKTVLIMLGISLLTMSLGSSIYHLIAGKSLISLIIGGTVTFGSTLLLIYAFNIANIKIILFKKSHA
ncbi:MAG: oligosaccharide flippase family protein [Clostridia bacterium]|nr:oligosaccharide flippase family protein [Clostridia bacterium]